MAETTKTRERKVEGDKSDAAKKREQEQAEAKARAEAKRAEAAEKSEAKKAEQEKAKAERDAKRAEEKAAKDKEREEKKAAKTAEATAARQALIDSGSLIEHTREDGTVVTYTASTPKKESVAQRAVEVIERLMSSDTPVSGKELADELGGGTVQWVAFFGMLRVMGFVTAYRYSTGNRGEGGLAYKWTGPTDLELVRAAVEEASDES